MKGRLQRTALVLSLPAALAACGGTTPSISISATQARPQQAAAPAPTAGGAGASVLRFAQGQWLGSCQADSDRSPYRYKLIFSGLTLTQETSIYQDSDCAQLLSTWSRKLAVTTVHSFDPDGNVYGYDLDVEAKEVKMTTFAGYGAIAGDLCGLSSWVDGTARDVSGLDCGPGRQETIGDDSVIYLRHDTGSDELIYDYEALKRQ